MYTYIPSRLIRFFFFIPEVASRTAPTRSSNKILRSVVFPEEEKKVRQLHSLLTEKLKIKNSSRTYDIIINARNSDV